MAERIRPTARAAGLVLAALVLAAPACAAEAGTGLFDLAARAETLKDPAYATIREACMARDLAPPRRDLSPIPGLGSTEGYGSDTSAEDFSWAVMVLSGRTLAGDAPAREQLRTLLLDWARAGAFAQTEVSHNAYYALKRQLLPLVTAYAILEPDLSPQEAARLSGWIDPLVRAIDHRFGGDVDVNNHRTLADSVLAAWGATVGDEALLAKGRAGFVKVIGQMRPDGTLPLEARRGARSLWYHRQTLASLAAIAEAARGQGVDLYAARPPGAAGDFGTLLGALANGLSAPVVLAAYSVENHKPGPEADPLSPDLGFLDRRGHDRHYLAFLEAVAGRGDGLAFDRMDRIFAREVKDERPLIDEFVGGNATCFWGRP